MTKFVNKGDEIDHYFPSGHPDSLRVATGQVVDVGDLKVVDAGDCFLVGDGDDVRAWAKSRWEKQGSSQKTPAPKTESDKPATKSE